MLSLPNMEAACGGILGLPIVFYSAYGSSLGVCSTVLHIVGNLPCYADGLLERLCKHHCRK